MKSDYLNLPSSREEAKKLGYMYYYTGIPCRYGHYSKRNTKYYYCFECRRESYKEWYNKNREYILEKRKTHHEMNKVHNHKLDREWRERNRGYNKYRLKKWREENKEHDKERNSNYKKINKEHILAYKAEMRANKLKATPLWADLNEIKKIYNNCPEGYEVDHIVPLNGNTVCGLHVENNLQHLTRLENIKKSNKLLEEYS